MRPLLLSGRLQRGVILRSHGEEDEEQHRDQQQVARLLTQATGSGRRLGVGPGREHEGEGGSERECEGEGEGQGQGKGSVQRFSVGVGMGWGLWLGIRSARRLGNLVSQRADVSEALDLVRACAGMLQPR